MKWLSKLGLTRTIDDTMEALMFANALGFRGPFKILGLP